MTREVSQKSGLLEFENRIQPLFIYCLTAFKIDEVWLSVRLSPDTVHDPVTYRAALPILSSDYSPKSQEYYRKREHFARVCLTSG
jgi:hypothetical protein